MNTMGGFNSDVLEIAKWRRADVQKKDRNPVEWMEWQANVGSQCLLMPRTRLRRRLREELDGMRTQSRHMGYKLQAVGRALAKEYNVCNYQMRNRMIQLGYRGPEARYAYGQLSSDETRCTRSTPLEEKISTLKVQLAAKDRQEAEAGGFHGMAEAEGVSGVRRSIRAKQKN